MPVVAHVFCFSKPNLPPAASQATRGRESESGMTGTLQKLVVSKALSISPSKSLLPVSHGRAGGLLTFIHRHHSTVYRFEGTQFPSSTSFDEPLLPLLLLGFILAWRAICPKNPWRAFLGTQLFIGADYTTTVAPEKWRIHIVKLVSDAERVFDELWLPSYPTCYSGGPQQTDEHL